MFERADLRVDAFLKDLYRSVSDDGALTDHLEVTPLRRTRIVPAGGSIRETVERQVRFTQIVRYHDPTGVVGLVATFGVRRWTFLLAYPATLVQVPLFVYGLVRRTFFWGGRRYRWHSKYNVEIVGRTGGSAII